MTTADTLSVESSTGSLEEALRARVAGEVRFDEGSRGAYSTDASNYRQIPIAVVVPKSVDDAVEAIAVCRDHQVPVLSRGGGTSLAGQCCNTAVVIDWSKYCHAVVSVDQENRTAVVEPGIVLDELNAQVQGMRLQVGPKPSTHTTCTIGGMIGNNSCGASAQAYGKMVDSVVRLEVLTYDGTRMWVGETDDATYAEIVAEGGRRAEIYEGLRRIRDEHLAEIRKRYPDIPRRVSGYNLDSLLPENRFNVAQALVGSENTLVTVLRAEIQLVPLPAAHALVVLGYPGIAEAADNVPAIVDHQPSALEGMDKRLIDLEHSRSLAGDAIERLPAGKGWLMVQFAGDDQDEAGAKAQRLVDSLQDREPHPTCLVIDDVAQQEQLWAAREAGLGATAYPPDGHQTHAGWEDSAVSPDDLGDYLRKLRALLDEFGYGSASFYGHFGQACVHTRIPFDLKRADGIAHYREFVERAAHLVVEYGGSLSGEHGDGQARGELLPIMFGPEIMHAFEQLKGVFDPDNRMNPGKVVLPNRLDDDLRQGVDYRPWEPSTHFAFARDDHRFSQAAARCVGVGKCRRHDNGVMCPSYRATREEEHSTRGRSRLLFEMLEGDVITDGWRSEAVHEALDLCLACKGCRSDCPVNVDMATYKSEFLSHHFEGRLRPLAHYSMGWLPLWALLARPVTKVVNAVAQTPGPARLVKLAGGVDQHREVPLFAAQPFTAWYAGHRRRSSTGAARGKVLLWPDTFTNRFDPGIAKAAVRVLEAAGFEVVLPDTQVCCGLTLISTGQLATAKRVLRRTIDVLRPYLEDGTPIVVLEPSCAAVFRGDLPELLHDDEDAHRVSRQTLTLAQLLAERAPDWRPPSRLAQDAIVQLHCHQHAILGHQNEEKVLDQALGDVRILDAGCCGLAGNFGFERGHYDVSMACAEDKLLPEVRNAGQDLVLADGFSCRTQVEQAEGVQPWHTAEILAAALDGRLPERPERPEGPGVLARAAVAAAALAPVAVLAGLARARLRRSLHG